MQYNVKQINDRQGTYPTIIKASIQRPFFKPRNSTDSSIP